NPRDVALFFPPFFEGNSAPTLRTMPVGPNFLFLGLPLCVLCVLCAFVVNSPCHLVEIGQDDRSTERFPRPGADVIVNHVATRPGSRPVTSNVCSPIFYAPESRNRSHDTLHLDRRDWPGAGDLARPGRGRGQPARRREEGPGAAPGDLDAGVAGK